MSTSDLIEYYEEFYFSSLFSGPTESNIEDYLELEKWLNSTPLFPDIEEEVVEEIKTTTKKRKPTSTGPRRSKGRSRKTTILRTEIAYENKATITPDLSTKIKDLL
jgi:hypothetical protein